MENVEVNLSVQLAPRNKRGLELKNPVMVASGVIGYGMEYAELVDIKRLGAIVSKGTTLSPRMGNPQPRLFETASGLLNSVGLQNIGIDALVAEKAPVWDTWGVPVLAHRLEGIIGISGIEINISCPNVAAGGIEFGKSPDMASAVTRAVKSQTTLPIIVKLTPNVTDIVALARAVEEAGADAISLINTLRGMAIDITERRPFLGGVTGGLSGPAIKPIALYMVYQVAQAVAVPIIGCGGIASDTDALEFIMAGASAVQVGTVVMTSPRAPIDIVDGIERFMERERVAGIDQLIGVTKSFLTSKQSL
jgi:dihydroorotate dehydrogenase (NAD+) catalytic subunit